MSKYNDAALALERQAVKFEGLMAAALALRELGSLDQAAEEAERRLASLEEGIRINEDVLSSANSGINEAREQAAKIEQRANDLALSKLEGADEEAGKIVSEAEARANQILDRAKESYGQALSGLDEQVRLVKQNKLVLEGEVSQLLETCATKRNEAEELERRITQARAEISKMLG